jgi:GDP-D-mannose 3',5'-epimerase
VRGRNSDNTLLRQVLGWEPEISLEKGLTRTYAWIEDQLIQEGVHQEMATLQAR